MSLLESFKTSRWAAIQARDSRAPQKSPGSEDPGYSSCIGDSGCCSPPLRGGGLPRRPEIFDAAGDAAALHEERTVAR